MSSINFANALGIHESALHLRGKRAEVLANNLANADTPGFKARDLDFQGLLNGKLEHSAKGLQMDATNSGHRHAKGLIPGADGLLYRNAQQPSIDGNTVEEHVEHGEFMKNSMAYQASFTFLNGKFKGLMTAIKGQ